MTDTTDLWQNLGLAAVGSAVLLAPPVALRVADGAASAREVLAALNPSRPWMLEATHVAFAAMGWTDDLDAPTEPWAPAPARFADAPTPAPAPIAPAARFVLAGDAPMVKEVVLTAHGRAAAAVMTTEEHRALVRVLGEGGAVYKLRAARRAM